MGLLVNIDVDDLERATAFYTAVFGLKVGRRFDRWATELLGFESPLYLLAKDAGTLPYPQAALGRTYERHWTPVHLDFAVDDLEAVARRAEEAGATREGEVEERRWGRIAYFADPWGHGFCLLQFEGRGYDEIATRA